MFYWFIHNLIICFRLHFRPKTPPPDWEPPCDMLLCQDTFFDPCNANAPFSMEIQTLDPANNTLLSDKTSYITEPFGAMTDFLDVSGTTASTSGAVTLPSGALTSHSGASMSSSSTSNPQQASSSQDPPVNTLILPHSVSFSTTYGYDTNSRDSTSSSDSNSDYRTIGCTTFRLRDCGESSSCGTTHNNSRQYQQQSGSTQQNRQRSHQHQKRATGDGAGGSGDSGGTTGSSSLSRAPTTIRMMGSGATASGLSNSPAKAALSTATVDEESVLAVRFGTTGGTVRPRGGNIVDSQSTIGNTNGLLTQFGFDGKSNCVFFIVTIVFP